MKLQTALRLFTGLWALTALAACSRHEEPAPAPAAQSATPAPATAPAPVAALSEEQKARLVRPHSPVLGPAGAPVTLVEFLDPACEACRAFAPVVKQVMFLYPQEVRVVVRFAAFHEGSDEAIRLIEAARRQGKFEPVLTALFEGQDQWASHHQPNLDEAWKIAAAAGVILPKARRDAVAAEVSTMMKLEAEDILALQVSRTPTFYVNGKLLTDFGAEQLMQLVKDEVTRSSPAAQSTNSAPSP